MPFPCLTKHLLPRQHWGGDCESTFEAMAEALRGALSLTLSGFGFASHDIGGFEVHIPKRNEKCDA